MSLLLLMHYIQHNKYRYKPGKTTTKIFKLLTLKLLLVDIKTGFLQRYKSCAATHLDIEYRSLIFSFIDNVKPTPDKPKTKFKSIDLLDQ